MQIGVRRLLVVTGCLAAFAGGSEAIQAAAREPAPPTPLAGASRLSGELQQETAVQGRLRSGATVLAQSAALIAAREGSLSAEITAARQQVAMLALQHSTVLAAAPVVHAVTGASGHDDGGGDSGGGDDGN